MFPFNQILPMLVAGVLQALFNPLFWLVVAIVALQYSRMAAVKEKLFGIRQGGVWRDTATATLYGLAGGLLGSIIMVVMGVTLSESGLIYLWPLAILLMLINARFLCFAYAGGILALAHLLTGFPQVNVPQLLALVAILHMVESALIWFSGHLGAVPSYFKEPGGRVLGGFTLQKFWPIPIVALIVTGYSDLPAGINMPEWWPLIKPVTGAENIDHVIYALFPVVAGLGYGDLCLARSPVEKSRISAVNLFMYSVTLLLLAVASQYSLVITLLAALFSPLGHEMIIHLGKQMEFRGKPIYAPSSRGLRVLDVVPGTPAWQSGIRSGDILLAINGAPIFNKEGLAMALPDFYLPAGFWMLEVEYLQGDPPVYRRETAPQPAPGKSFGLLPAPQGNEENYMQLSTAGPLGRWWGRFWKR